MPKFVVQVARTEYGEFVIEADDAFGAWNIAGGLDEFALANGPCGEWEEGAYEIDCVWTKLEWMAANPDADDLACLPVWPRANILSKR